MSELELARGRAVVQSSPPSELTADQPIIADRYARFVDPSLATYADTTRRGPIIRLLSFVFSLWPSLVLFVILPALAITYYYAFVAADQFVVEWKFVVRQVEDTSFSKGTTTFDSEQGGAESGMFSQGGKESSGSSAGKSTGGGSSRSSSITIDNQDGYVVASYIQSPAVVRDLSKMLNLREIFSRPEADFWARLRARATADELTSYWLNTVSSYIDRPSGIVTVDFHAFRRWDALAVANAVDILSANLVNNLSLRARQESLERAEQEVDRSEKAMRAVMADFESFRNRAGLIDPNSAAANTSDLLKQLLSERIETDSKLSVLKQLRPRAPEIITLKTRLESIDMHIAELQATLTAKERKAGTIAAALATFEELRVREQLAEQIYTDARNDEERARQTAEKRWLYIATFQPPALPDDSEYPDRIGFSTIGATLLFAAWSIAALVRMSILDHRT
jgi:capsular polysaccharide transport system permease protein